MTVPLGGMSEMAWEGTKKPGKCHRAQSAPRMRPPSRVPCSCCNLGCHGERGQGWSQQTGGSEHGRHQGAHTVLQEAGTVFGEYDRQEQRPGEGEGVEEVGDQRMTGERALAG